MNGLKILAGASLLVATGFFLTACGGEMASPRQPPPPQVSAVSVSNRDMAISYEYAGRISAFKETQVRARVGGILLHRYFTEGQYVSEGDVLFELDPATYEAEVARQKALVAQAEAVYQQSVNDAKRAEELLRQRVQSAAQRDQMTAIRDANEASLAQARAALQVSELNLDYSRVRAPISGITSREAVSEGSLIASGGLLTTITQSDPAYVNFSYSDEESREIQDHLQVMADHGEPVEHLNVRIRFGDGHEYDKQGVIDFTSPTLDMLTGTIGVRAVVDNEQGQLVPGQFVRVKVTGLKIYEAMVIPEQALMQDSSGTFVYLVDEKNEIERRPVVIRRQLSDRNWWLEAAEERIIPATEQAPEHTQQYGLEEGERVIVEGHYRIQMALAQMPPSERLTVTLANLDGQNLLSPAAEGGDVPAMPDAAQMRPESASGEASAAETTNMLDNTVLDNAAKSEFGSGSRAP